MSDARGGRLAAARRTVRAAGRSRAAFAVWVVLVALVLVPLLFRGTAEVGPGTIRASIRPVLDGRTELAVPPIGAVRAETHVAPVELGFELREVDLLGALGPDGRPGIAGIEAEVQDDLPGAVRSLAIDLAAVSVVTGVLAAAAFPGRRTVRRVAAGAVLAPAAVALLVAPASIGFDPDRFEDRPQLSGPLLSAPELLQQVGSLETRFGSVESRTRVLAERIAGLYSAAVTRDIERSDGEVVLLHVSDLHLNSVGLSLARDLAENFDVDAVVDTGDITSFGFEPEAGFVELLDDFDVPYFVVPGNHDSESVRRQLARSDAVRYLDGEAVDIGGVRVLGIGDPTVTALRRIPKEELDRTYEEQFATTRRLVRSEEPDLLLVHNPKQITPVTGDVPVAAAGHLHETRLDVVDGSVVTVVGSSGATGVGNLLVDERAPFSFQLLRFLDGRLVAVDQIELRGADGDFVLNRRLIRDDEEDTSGDSLTAEVDEPPLDEVDEEQLERLPTSTSTTSTSTTTTSTTAVAPDD